MRYKLILIAVLLLTACGTKKQSDTKEAVSANNTVVALTPEQLKNAKIEIGYATQQNMKSIIKVSGKIDVPPQNMVSVSFPLGGYLKSTKLLPGMHIAKGEVIAIMEDPQYIQLQQDFLTAMAKQNYLESEYLRQRELNKSKASSDKTFQQAETEYKSNRILISGLRQKLELIGINPDRLTESSISKTVSVHAPIAGFVSAVKANIGKYVTPSDVLFELVNPTDIHLALTVFEKDINSLYLGQKLLAYTNTNPGKKYPCEVILIGKDVSLERSIQVHCHFEKYDKTLIPGMYMNAEIEAEVANANVLREEAVVRYGDKQFIFIAQSNNRFEMKEVQTGVSENGFVSITQSEGLDLKKQALATKNAYAILMQLKNTAE